MPLHYHKDGHVAVFTIENGSVNPTTPAMHKELFLALKDFLADTSIRCGILTGTGERGFCAGDDIKTPYRNGLSPKEELTDHLWPHHDEGEEPVDFRGITVVDSERKTIASASEGEIFAQHREADQTYFGLLLRGGRHRGSSSFRVGGLWHQTHCAE